MVGSRSGREELSLQTCTCGAELRTFWLWQDAEGGLHASGYRPTAGTVRTVLAATARDALLPVDGRMPKHGVWDVDNPNASWEGRCSVAVSA
jgi:hypothetical protein